MHRSAPLLGLLLLLGACTPSHSAPSVPLAPEVQQRINREVQRGRTVVELEDTVLRTPVGVRLSSDSVRWSVLGVEHRAPASALRCIRISNLKPAYADRAFWGALTTLGAGLAMTAVIGAAEGGPDPEWLAAGMLINTAIAFPLAFPLGAALTPPQSRTYTFPGASASADPVACGAEP